MGMQPIALASLASAKTIASAFANGWCTRVMDEVAKASTDEVKEASTTRKHTLRVTSNSMPLCIATTCLQLQQDASKVQALPGA